VDAERSDGVAERVLLLRRERGGAGGDNDDVEALVKANVKGTGSGTPGAAGPAVHGGEVLQERRLHGTGEAAALAGAVAWLVRACPGVGVVDRVDHLLHGVAPEVAAGDRGAADMSAGRLPQLVVGSWHGEHTT